MTGLRERKKEQTKQRITAVALQLFAERGFDAVTVSEIAEAAEVAKATLFSYFPSKESLALQGVGQENLAEIVARRPAGLSPLQALQAHYEAFADGHMAAVDRGQVLAQMRVIFDSPTLSGAANALLYQQRRALADVLAEEYGETAAALVAAQVAATALTLRESFFHILAGGASPQEAVRALAKDTELAFALLEHGVRHLKGR
ncbi:TetR/AcrR family transcriptional regulator [Yinghuangia sp. ASG 101]|uniref:TetR family transcriptional regulator n=1 Tax=Yinghuangia sp. ASG 101 TaxID=2896848 RepID=UPI001E625192|nr:TetR family transcriptional regulator [Yinghuangia sp. ASG 101]UGQ12056.1 TetR/AcrR family transcriptional regulator [Yinghuangia sp. ASG 101]